MNAILINTLILIGEATVKLFAMPVIGAHDEERLIRKSKIIKGLKEGTIIYIGGRFYEKYVVE